MQSRSGRQGVDPPSSSSAAAGNSSVVHHFRQNFELSGFGSPGEALVQTVKELVDNAIDACRIRTSDQDAPTVRVVLRRPTGTPANDTRHDTATRTSSSNSSSEQRQTADDPGDDEEEPLELQVADNGAGLTDVTKALVLFSSTKSGHGSAPRNNGDTASSSSTGKGQRTEQGTTAGKYGLGLTLSLLYSQKHYGGSLKVTTATADSREWSFTKCDIDLETGLPRPVYRKSGLKPASWSQGCGTDMRLLVPGEEDALRFAAPRLRTFFARMHLLPDRAAGVSFVCEGCLDDMSVWVPRGGRGASPHLLLDNNDLVRAFAKGLTAMAEADNNHTKIQRAATTTTAHKSSARRREGESPGDETEDDGGYLAQHRPRQSQELTQRQEQQDQSVKGRRSQDHDQRRGEGTTAGQGDAAELLSLSSSSSDSCCRHPQEDVAVFECEGKNGTLVTVGVAVERTLPTPSKSQQTPFTHEPQTSHETTVPLLLHRSANGVPMLDTNTSTACALVAGVAAKGGWRGLGLRISSAPSLSRVRGGDGRLRFVLSEAPTPLKIRGGAEWSALSGIKAVHVSVMVSSETVPYTSLRKDAIAHKEGYVSATESAVRQSLLSLAARKTGGFRSAAEAAEDMMHEDLIPLVASSVASMVSRSADVNFQKKCLQVLGVGNEFVQERRLTDLLRCELEENIHREEERRAAARARAVARRAQQQQQEAAAAKEKNKSKEKKKRTRDDHVQS